jgi:hypothetical protein
VDEDEENVTADPGKYPWHVRCPGCSAGKCCAGITAAGTSRSSQFPTKNFTRTGWWFFLLPVRASEWGFDLHHLPHTVYDRGVTRTNPLEAEAVVDAVMEHARKSPRVSLGVVAFSAAQREAIEDVLETRRKASPETEEFFKTSSEEPFFIKNLENVQGDERDVIFISIGYGRTKEGYVSMSFGPLNNDGGEKRLNVLITRPGLRCEVLPISRPLI